jgi:hypothetical protein
MVAKKQKRLYCTPYRRFPGHERQLCILQVSKSKKFIRSKTNVYRKSHFSIHVRLTCIEKYC